MPRLTPSERLLLRLRELGLDLPEDASLVRTNAPRSARSNAAWSWFALGPDGAELHVGSRHPIGELLAAPVLVAHEDGNSSPYDPDVNITTPDVMD
ncbi:hypothetical protein ACFY0G_02195 [Streptomyces sp. NPDC001552]|uniref:hypothetical protein n=1 Tax=Streptomyces sp. NPDC001552 TaxID=3364587 RepID=UPI0036A2D3BE